MTAPPSVLSVTSQVEVSHAELIERLAALQRHYDDEEQEALAAYLETRKAIRADFERQRADLAAQVRLSSLPASFEDVLRQKRDLELEALVRTYQEQANARRKQYEAERQRYHHEVYTLITGLITAPPALTPSIPPPSVSRPQLVAKVAIAEPAAVTSTPAGPIKIAPAPPTRIEVTLQPKHHPATLLPTQAPSTENGSQIPPFQSISGSAQSTSSQYFEGHHTPDTIAGYPQQPRREIYEAPERASRDSSPASSMESLQSSPPRQKTPPAAPATSIGRHELPTLAARPHVGSQSPQKRKAHGELPSASPATAPSSLKRARLEEADEDDANGEAAAPQRTITFREVYGEKGGVRPKHRHIIVQYPSGSGKFYILRCDQHGVHFGEHPLRGAAKHLASAQHGNMSKAHATAIATVGHLVLGCTQELADENNREVLEGFQSGAFKIFNANNLSQTKRAELGYGPLETSSSQKPATPRRLQAAPVSDPVACRFYVGSIADSKCPVLVLPWGDTLPAGIQGTLADTGLFHDVSEDGRHVGVPKLPKCYVYDEEGGRIKGILGWAKGYETGGPLEKRREFPVMCAENRDFRKWSVGWVKAAHLYPLDFSHPDSRNIPFIDEARHYFYTRVHRQRDDRNTAAPVSHETEGRRIPSPPHQGPGGQVPSQPPIPSATIEDVEMGDAGGVYNHVPEGYQNRDYAITNRENRPVGPPFREYLPEYPGSREAPTPRAPPESARASASAATSARLIAAQALNLQSPTRSAFTPINAAGSAEATASPSAPAVVEPTSRSNSVSSGGEGHRRVFKIYAHSHRPQSASHSPAAATVELPERPLDSVPPQGAAPIQPHGATEKRLSPASLQNIVQDFPGAALQSPQGAPHSSTPPVARRPLPSAPLRTTLPSQAPLPRAVAGHQEGLAGEGRAGSAPLQPLHTADPLPSVTRRAGSASAAPGPNRSAIPQQVPAPGFMEEFERLLSRRWQGRDPEPELRSEQQREQRREQPREPQPEMQSRQQRGLQPEMQPQAHSEPQREPQPEPQRAPQPNPQPTKERKSPPHTIQVPPPPTVWAQLPHLNTTPLATPLTSTDSTRANSPSAPPTQQQHPTKPDATVEATAATGPAGGAGPETPILTPTTTTTPGGSTTGPFVPTMDVFDLAGLMEGDTEVFRADASGGSSGQLLRLIDDHQSGVFSTPADAPVAVRVEPRRVRSVERAPVQEGVGCVVRITYHADGADQGQEPRTQTLVLDKARSTSSGIQNGVVHARRFCRRLRAWNQDIVFVSLAGSESLLDSIPRRFTGMGNETPLATPSGVSVAKVE